MLSLISAQNSSRVTGGAGSTGLAADRFVGWGTNSTARAGCDSSGSTRRGVSVRAARARADANVHARGAYITGNVAREREERERGSENGAGNDIRVEVLTRDIWLPPASMPSHRQTSPPIEPSPSMRAAPAPMTHACGCTCSRRMHVFHRLARRCSDPDQPCSRAKLQSDCGSSRNQCRIAKLISRVRRV